MVQYAVAQVTTGEGESQSWSSVVSTACLHCLASLSCCWCISPSGKGGQHTSLPLAQAIKLPLSGFHTHSMLVQGYWSGSLLPYRAALVSFPDCPHTDHIQETHASTASSHLIREVLVGVYALVMCTCDPNTGHDFWETFWERHTCPCWRGGGGNICARPVSLPGGLTRASEGRKEEWGRRERGRERDRNWNGEREGYGKSVYKDDINLIKPHSSAYKINALIS